MRYIGVVVALLLAGCGNSESTREDLLSCISPDTATRATFYRLYGGGAAGWQTLHVEIQSSDLKPEVVLTMSHGYDVVLEWQDKSTLVISYPASAIVPQSKQSFGGGTVQLRPQDSKSGSLVGGSRCVAAQPVAAADGLAAR